MKKILFVFLGLIISLNQVIAQDLAYSGNKAKDISVNSKTSVEWEKEIHDFGKVKKDKPVTAIFEFTNTGNNPLIISKVIGSCGCTATNFAKEPVLPGKKSKVTATYNAKAGGTFTKSVTVYANTKEGEKKLKIKGTVVE